MAGENAAQFAKEHGTASVADEEVKLACEEALMPLDSDKATHAGGAYQVQYELQDVMQDKVGIVRTEDELLEAIDAIEELKVKAQSVSAPGNRQYNPGWHTALDLQNLLTVSEAVARSAVLRKESRGAHTRDDYPDKDESFSSFNHVVRKSPDGEMQVTRETISEMPEELKQIIEDHK